jgi:4'-phosphopantetheinyl transferase
MSVEGLEPVTREPGSALPGAGETHVWAFSLDLGTSTLDALRPLLAADENARAERMRIPRDRARYIAGRAQLRQLIGDCVGLPPESLRFDYSPAGKPILACSAGATELRFNAAGSAGLGLLALRTDAEVGVDVEQIRPLADISALARRMLAADEYKDYAAAPQALRLTRFFEYWVRKEAAAKAMGRGLPEGLHRLRIPAWSSGEEPRQVECISDGNRAAIWVIGVPIPLAGFAAALAATQPIGAVLSSWWEPRLPDPSVQQRL